MKFKFCLIFLSLFSIKALAQKERYIVRSSASFRLYYDKEQNLVTKDYDYMFFTDVQTDKDGNVIGWIDFKHKSGVVFSQERWLKISNTHHDKNIINEVKLFDPNTGALTHHMIAKNPENLPYETISKNISGIVYEYENSKLRSLRTLYMGNTITEVLYGNNGIQKYGTYKSFHHKYYWETVSLDNNGQSYKIIEDDLKKESWINWNEEFDLKGVYKNNEFWVSGTRDYGASIFQELPFDCNKDHSISLSLERISGNDFAGLTFGAQAGGLQNFWSFTISNSGFYQIIKSFNGIIMPLKLRQERMAELPSNYKNAEIDNIIKNDIPIGYSTFVVKGKNALNTLDVRRIGRQLVFSINKKIVEKIDDADLFGTGTGFLIAMNSPGSTETNTIGYSDFVVTEYSPEIPEWLNINPSVNKMPATGTGFAISQDGVICTNYHVIQGAKNINVYIGGKKVQANILIADEENDLALLKLTKTNLISQPIPYRFENYSPSIGENVFVLGFPSSHILGQSIKLTNGIVSSSKGYKDDDHTFQVSVPIHPGNSGSPLFDNDGNLIGVINSGIPTMDNVGYAIKTQGLLNLMKAVSAAPVSQTRISPSEPLSAKAKKIADFIFLIEAEL